MSKIFCFILSFCIIGLGQPARCLWLCPLAAALGFALFFTIFEAKSSKKERFCIAALWFFCVQMVQLSWMSSIAFQGYYILFVYFALSLGLGLQFGIFAICLPQKQLPFISIFALSALWTIFEWARIHVLCGFSWNPIGLALSYSSVPLRSACLFGVFGLSFWVMACNLSALKMYRERQSIGYAFCVWIAMVCLPYIFGLAHLFYHKRHAHANERQLCVALVQTGLLPSEKVLLPQHSAHFIPPGVQWQKILDYLSEKPPVRRDLIVLPEAVVPLHADYPIYPFESVRQLFVQKLGAIAQSYFPPLEQPFAKLQQGNGGEKPYVSNLFWAQTLANAFGSQVLIGLDHFDPQNKRYFNSAFLVSPYPGMIERYDKRMLLPLAEYLPFEWLRRFTQSYGICDFFSKGEKTALLGSGLRIGVCICYEETFSEAMRRTLAVESDLLVNLTNDNYYPHSLLPEQHFTHARLRAVENGRPLLRSCNTGVTAVIDSLGRVVARFGCKEEEFKRGVLDCTFSAYKYRTLYSLWGDAAIIGISFGCLGFFSIRAMLKNNIRSQKIKSYLT